MHSAYDRDEYITIHWENIQSGLEKQFMKFPNSEVTFFNTTYDYHSAMHYGPYFFSKNGKPTIVPKVNGMQIRIKYRNSKILNFIHYSSHTRK